MTQDYIFCRTELIPIADVKIPQGREPCRNVRVLVESIEKVGLLNPITVRAIQLFEAGAEPRAGYRLVAGRNRLEAMKQLGHTEIPATVISLEDLEYRLAEFDENLIRSDIPVIDQAARLKKHKQIYEALWPETGWGKAQKNNAESKDDNMSSFQDSAAAKIGVTPRTIRRLVLIGRLPLVNTNRFVPVFSATQIGVPCSNLSSFISWTSSST